jgi:Family of unknown function (DUF6338)
MPDTFLGLAILIILFMPGVIFAIQADSRRPAHELSPLRELISIAGVGTICNVVVLLIFGLLRSLFPTITPNIGQMARAGSEYIRLHFVSVSWWAFGLFFGACILAWILGRFWPGVAGRFVSGEIFFTSAWWELFHKYPDRQVYIGCELNDGTYISGYLIRYSTESDETPHRELALAGPIIYRASGSDVSAVLQNVDAMSLRAGQMKYLTVTYLPLPATPDVIMRTPQAT